jgi:hypothetical protein
MISNELSNLVSHRARAGVWDKRGWSSPTIEGRVGRPCVVSLVGAGLVVYSASRRLWRGAWWIVNGASIIAKACADFSNPRYARRTLRDRFDWEYSSIMAPESIDSFLASDAPSLKLAVSAVVRSKPLCAVEKKAETE